MQEKTSLYMYKKSVSRNYKKRNNKKRNPGNSKYNEDLFDLQTVLQKAQKLPKVRMAVVAPYDIATLRALRESLNRDVAIPVLIGHEGTIRDRAKEYDISLEGMEIINTALEEQLEKAGEFIKEGDVKIVMKGMVGTGDFIHVLLDPKYGIRTGRILSHVSMFEIPETRRIFLMSDAAINILPNFNRKVHIVANAVEVARKIGIPKIKVAMLAAVEKVRLPAMPATLDAFLMKKFATTGYFGECIVEGPFAFDNAIDPERAKTKGIYGRVAGVSNIVIVPNIETGNVIYKSITCLHKMDGAGVVVGGRMPIVVPSRSDNWRTKFLSIEFSKLLAS